MVDLNTLLQATINHNLQEEIPMEDTLDTIVVIIVSPTMTAMIPLMMGITPPTTMATTPMI